MTWVADAQQNRPEGNERDQLILQRSILVGKIEKLRAAPLPTKSQASLNGRMEDLTALAKQVTSIDKKLGRIS